MLVSINHKKLLTHLVITRSLISVYLIARLLKKAVCKSVKVIQRVNSLVSMSTLIVSILVRVMEVALMDAKTVPVLSVLAMIMSPIRTT